MDAADEEAFDKFVEKHWGNRTKEPVQVSAVPVESAPKRRGRRPKTEV